MFLFGWPSCESFLSSGTGLISLTSLRHVSMTLDSLKHVGALQSPYSVSLLVCGLLRHYLWSGCCWLPAVYSLPRAPVAFICLACFSQTFPVVLPSALGKFQERKRKASLLCCPHAATRLARADNFSSLGIRSVALPLVVGNCVWNVSSCL